MRNLINKDRHQLKPYIKLDTNQMTKIQRLLAKNETVLNRIYANIYRIGGNINQIAHICDISNYFGRLDDKIYVPLQHAYAPLQKYRIAEEAIIKYSNNEHDLVKGLIRRDVHDNQKDRNQ